MQFTTYLINHKLYTFISAHRNIIEKKKKIEENIKNKNSKNKEMDKINDELDKLFQKEYIKDVYENWV